MEEVYELSMRIEYKYRVYIGSIGKEYKYINIYMYKYIYKYMYTYINHNGSGALYV